MITVKIPGNWTAKEAVAVYDFLTEVMAAIWEQHEDQLIESFLQEEQGKLADQMDWIEVEARYDEIPF